MASPFAGAERAAAAAQNRWFGERVRIEPCLPLGPGRGELGGPRPDPARPVREVRAVFTLRGAADTLQGVRRGTEINGMTRLAVAEAHLWLPGAEIGRLGYALGADDRVVLIARPDAPAYRIVKREPSDVADGRYPLVVSPA